VKTQEYDLKELCLEVTDLCPLNCLHCSGMCNSKAQNMLSFHQIKKIISDFAILGGEVLEISGGEPLLHPALLQIVDYARKKEIQTIFYTSGNKRGDSGQITPINVKLASKLHEAGLEKVIFSLQGATSITHESITQTKGSFDNALHSIEVMREIGFWIGLHFVPMKVNCDDFRDFCELSKDLQVNEIGVLRFVPQGRGYKNKHKLQLNISEFADFNIMLLEIANKSKFPKIRVGRPIDFRFVLDHSQVKTECDAGKSRCLISPDGKVKPCPAFKNGNDKYVAGNVLSKTLVDIWANPSNWDVIRQFEYNKIKEPCNSCDLLEKCKGGCIAQRLLRYNNPVIAPDPCCFKCVRPKEITSLAEPNTREQSLERLLSVQT
jgi:radical SAM protein with 4Fe4S-binding SPASM domain